MERLGYSERKEANLPLGREVSVTGGDAEEVGVVLGEIIWGDNGEVRLRRCVHLVQDLLRQSFGYPKWYRWDARTRIERKNSLEDVSLAAGFLNPSFLSHGH